MTLEVPFVQDVLEDNILPIQKDKNLPTHVIISVRKVHFRIKWVQHQVQPVNHVERVTILQRKEVLVVNTVKLECLPTKLDKVVKQHVNIVRLPNILIILVVQIVLDAQPVDIQQKVDFYPIKNVLFVILVDILLKLDSHIIANNVLLGVILP